MPGQLTKRQGVLRQGISWLTKKIADKCLKITILLGCGCQVLFMEQRWGRWGSKVKRQSCKYLLEWQALRRGCVNLFFPGATCRQTESRRKAFWFNIQAEGQGSPRQPIMYKQYPFSEQKQRAAKVKVTDPTWGQNWLLSETLFCPGTLVSNTRVT